MPIWLTTTCPKTLIVTRRDVLESGNAKNRVNLTCSVCARCGDEVLCGAENAVFGRVQTSACERAKNCAQMDPNRLTCLIGHGNRSLTSKIDSLLPSRSSAAACLLARSHVHATLPCARGPGVMHAGRISTVNQNRHSSSEIARRSEYSHSQSTHAAHFPVALTYSSPFLGGCAPRNQSHRISRA